MIKRYLLLLLWVFMASAMKAQVNDNICNAIPLVLNGAADCQTTEAATVEANEPTYSCSTPNNTVWYTYTPTTGGVVKITVSKNSAATTDLNAWVNFFTATGTCPALTLTDAFGTCNNADLTTQDSVELSSGNLVAGTTYYIMIDGFAGASGGFCIRLSNAPPPPPCTVLLTPANNATNVSSPAADLTWMSVAGATGYDVALGTTNPPATLGNTPDTTVNITGLTPNTTYYWTVYPTNAGVPASGCTVYSFTTGVSTGPANDAICDAIPLVLDGPSDCETTETATVEADEPTFGCSSPNNTLWYTYTPTVSGPIKITMGQNAGATTSLDAWVSLFTATGTCPSLTLTEAFAGTCEEADLTLADSVEITSQSLVAGTTYYIMIDGFAGATGGYCIHLSSTTVVAGPANDAICDAIPLTLNGASDCQTTETGTIEANEPTFGCSTPNNTLWYTYTPTVSGPIKITMGQNAGATTSLDAWVSLFTATGTCPGLTLTEAFAGVCEEADLTTLDSVEIVSQSLTAGTTYYIMIDGFSGAVGGYCIHLSDAPAAPPCTTLITPLNNAVNVAIPVQLTWNSVAAANGYDVVLDTNNPPTTVLGNTVDTTVSITGLAYSTTYYWTVNPTNSGVPATGCTVYSFTTGPAPAAPVNDVICDAIPLTLNGPSDCETTESATVDADEPAFGCSTPNNTVWYTYTPTVSGPVKITMGQNASATTSLDAWVSFFTATGTCPTLTLTEAFAGTCEEADLTTLDSVEIISQSLVAGTTYYMMIDGFVGATGGFCVHISDAPAAPACTTLLLPLNNATNVSVPATQLLWNSVPGATGYDVAFGTASPAPVLGNVTDTTVTITGLSPNTTYYWTVYPVNNGVSATGCIEYSFTTGAAPAPPANDDCTGAISLTSVPMTGTTISATESVPANLCNGFTGDANDDVWYTVTATNAGNATVTVTPDGTFDAVIEAFTGTCGALTSLSCADDSVGGQSEILTLSNLAPGQIIYIRVFNFDAAGTEGTFTINADGTALPVRLVNLRGERTGTKNMLYWSTLSEQNNRGFELQRSADGENFSTLSFVQSKAFNGTSSTTLAYQFNDEKPLGSNNYYRLKQVDIDGKTSISNIVLIKGIKNNDLTISAVYPNPVKSDLKVILSSPVMNQVKLIITDLAGKTVLQQNATVINSDNAISINVANLPSGSYMIKALCANGCETAVSKFVKQ